VGQLVEVRVLSTAPTLNFPSKINSGRSLNLGRSFLIIVSPSMAGRVLFSRTAQPDWRRRRSGGGGAKGAEGCEGQRL
jgi:hypothetical protein